MLKKDLTSLTVLIVCLSLIMPWNLFADDKKTLDEVIDQEIAWLENEASVVFTASKTPENIKKSASTITVITDEEIRKMGARNIQDVLLHVPGIGLTQNFLGLFEIESRGVKTNFSEKILFMENGHPLNTNLANGGAVWVFDNMIVENIRRIEIIRGPGSALYGANAFLAVINIITKEARDIGGVEVSLSNGSFKTNQFNIQYGETINEFDVVVNFNVLKTDGIDAFIEADAIAGDKASMSPGYTDYWEEKYDFSLKLNYKDFWLTGRYVYRDTGVFAGPAHALSDDSNRNDKDFSLEAGYDTDLTSNLDLKIKFYNDLYIMDNFWEIFPEGYGPFVNGMLAESRAKYMLSGGQVETIYEFNDMNKIVSGFMFERQRQFDVGQSVNYNPQTGAPYDQIQDISDWCNWNKDVDRDIWAVFIEDIWDIHDDVRLTSGIRYDRYEDFGGTLNPRAGITWEFIKGYDVKFMYGSAFRAPTFGELYNQNSPALTGNPDIEPEKIQTYEISFGAEFMKNLNGRLTGFHNDISDIIEPSAPDANGLSVYSNAGNVVSNGVELDFKYTFANNKDSYIAVNYTYQDARNDDTDEHLPDIPQHKGNIISNIAINKYLNLNTRLYMQSKTQRADGDERSDLSGFEILDTTLIVHNFLKKFKGLEFRASIFNLLDKDYAHPAPANTFPDDYPRPGINYFIDLQYKF